MNRLRSSDGSSDNVFLFEEIESTQDFIKSEFLKSPSHKLIWARALRQTQGRGRQGRSWLNTDGALMTSCGFSIQSDKSGTTIDKLFAPFVSLIAFHLLYKSIISVVPELSSSLSFKWPNDLITLNSPGPAQKIAGILSESCGPGALVVGWGLNVQQSPLSSEVSATSLLELMERNKLPQPAQLADRIFDGLKESFEESIKRWLKNPTTFQQQVLAELRPLLSGFLGKHGQLSDGRKVQAFDIDEKGGLWVRDLESQSLSLLYSGEFLLES